LYLPQYADTLETQFMFSTREEALATVRQDPMLLQQANWAVKDNKVKSIGSGLLDLNQVSLTLRNPFVVSV
jgi:hypothetical protein